MLGTAPSNADIFLFATHSEYTVKQVFVFIRTIKKFRK